MCLKSDVSAPSYICVFSNIYNRVPAKNLCALFLELISKFTILLLPEGTAYCSQTKSCWCDRNSIEHVYMRHVSMTEANNNPHHIRIDCSHEMRTHAPFLPSTNTYWMKTTRLDFHFCFDFTYLYFSKNLLYNKTLFLPYFFCIQCDSK